MKQKFLQKYHWVHFCIGYLLQGMVCILNQLEKIIFFLCKWVSTGGSFFARNGSSCLVPPLSTGIPSDLDTQRPCAHCHSLCGFMCAPVLLSRKTCLSLVIHTLWLLLSFCLLFCILSRVQRYRVWWRHPIWDWVLQGLLSLTLLTLSNCGSSH